MSLERILKAESVAIVGASKNETKRGYQTIRTLLDEKYEGKIYPVNPREKSILGIKCYQSVSSIEGPVDVALVATPARTLPAVLEDCGQKGVNGAVVLAGGFGEMGPDGRKLETEMMAKAGADMVVVMGVAHPATIRAVVQAAQDYDIKVMGVVLSFHALRTVLYFGHERLWLRVRWGQQ